MQQIIYILFVLTTLQFNFLNAQYDCYNFRDEDADNWNNTCPACGGVQQSPIDLIQNYARRMKPCRLLKFENFQRSYSNAILFNDGHIVGVKLPESEPNPPIISGGFLLRPYRLYQVFFHWPSAHTINGRRYPFEMHMSFVQTEYGQNVLNFSDGLANIAVLFDRSPVENPNLQGIVNNLDKVRQANSSSTLTTVPPLGVFLPKNVLSYYTYHGSLMFPPCNEGANWIVFTHTLFGTSKQFEAFTQVLNAEGKNITRNNRPIQPLNNRALILT